MTSLVLIMNEKGLATAADSAASAGGKVFTADKVFEILEGTPACMMAYGRADVCTVPVEVVAGEYRRSRGGRSFGTVKEMAGDFMEFLNSEECRSVTDRHRMIYAARMLRECTVDYTRKARDDGCPADGLREYLEDVLKESISDSGHNPTGGEIKWLRKCINSTSEMDSLSDNRIWSDPETRGIILRIAATMPFDREYSGRTGIVFAGYGDDESMPSYCECRILGLSEKTLKWRVHSSGSIDADRRSCILSFAQDDVVRSVIEGMNPDVKRAVSEILWTTAFEFIRGTSSTNLEFREIDWSSANDIISRSLDRLDMQLHKAYRKPMEEVVALLDLSEMAVLAKSLVSATSIRRHVSWDAESVGGPIDVTTVTKSAGFRWIERNKL
ncbi:MAG: hypothetical protein Q4Q62_04005 [Thermoplasmata archaeon]|nr:hypothetical protein [Thermoplasmata archaeon]